LRQDGAATRSTVGRDARNTHCGPKLGTTAPDRWRQSSPLAGPAFCSGPGFWCSSTRGARSLSGPGQPMCDPVASDCLAVRGGMDRSIVSSASQRRSCQGADHEMPIFAPPPVAGLHLMAAFSDAVETACLARSRPITNSHKGHKGRLCSGSIAPRGRCNGYVGVGCAVFPPVSPRAASGRRNPSPA